MKIICAEAIPYAAEAFSGFGEVSIMPGRAITRADVRDADALIIRSTTRVSADLLEGSRVKFVGTATIGTDHLDIQYLEKRGIAWCSAPGCNANSVSEYIIAALMSLAQQHSLKLEGRVLAIVGVGRVGTKVLAKARALGLRAILNDPPRFDAEGDTAFRPLNEALAQADIVTLHVPLEKAGRHPTYHLAGEEFFAKLKPGAILLNAARGAVVDTDHMLAAMRNGRVSHAVLDTWELEPAYRQDALAAVNIGTPHIAGYSFDGKVNGTLIVYREFCRFMNKSASWTPDALLPEPLLPEIRVAAEGRPPQEVIAEVVRQAYDIKADDAAMRAGAVDDDKARAEHFDLLRRKYPDRREWNYTSVIASGASEELRASLSGLGFATP